MAPILLFTSVVSLPQIVDLILLIVLDIMLPSDAEETTVINKNAGTYRN